MQYIAEQALACAHKAEPMATRIIGLTQQEERSHMAFQKNEGSAAKQEWLYAIEQAMAANARLKALLKRCLEFRDRFEKANRLKR